jgi:catechol 2,3-dioxygenase-like lactoylglutathione lyase family enzyme
MPEWEKKIGAINLVVGDLERSKAFYRDVFGLHLQHEDEDTAMFRFQDTYVFLQRGASHDDGPSGDVLTLAQKGVGQFVIFVEDVDLRTVTGVCAHSPSPIPAATPGR